MRTVKSIFLVEDDLDDQEFFVEALNGIENTSLFGIASNGVEALEILSDNVIPDLIFMDIHMPHMNGIECLSIMGQRESWKNIPAVMLSTALPEIDKIRSLGARGFIEKPSDNRVLKDHIEKMIKANYTWDTSISNQNFTTLYSPGVNSVL